MAIDLSVIFGSLEPKLKREYTKATFENIVKVVYQGTTEKSGPWIAGGCGRQLAVNEHNFNDIDIWFKTPAQFEETHKRLTDTFDMYETYSSDNAITYQAGDYKVQLIKRAYYPSIDHVFRSFDFTCCQVAVDDDLRPYGPGLEDAKNMVLKMNHYDNKAFLARYAKYVGYGYVMDTEDFLKIIEREDINYEFDSTVLGY